MTTFVPDLTTLATFTVVSLVLFITPGPDMSLFLAKTLTGGRTAGLIALAGVMVGAFVHTMLAALGLSALLVASETAFAALKTLGALYLLWLAYDAVRNGSALTLTRETPPAESARRIFLIGVGSNLSNPKVVLFFVTFLPQFVRTDDPDAASKLFFLGSYFIVLTAPLSAVLILAADRLVHLLKQRPRLMRGIDFLFGGLFGLFALKILTEPSR